MESELHGHYGTARPNHLVRPWIELAGWDLLDAVRTPRRNSEHLSWPDAFAHLPQLGLPAPLAPIKSQEISPQHSSRLGGRRAAGSRVRINANHGRAGNTDDSVPRLR